MREEEEEEAGSTTAVGTAGSFAVSTDCDDVKDVTTIGVFSIFLTSTGEADIETPAAAEGLAACWSSLLGNDDRLTAAVAGPAAVELAGLAGTFNAVGEVRAFAL